MKMMTRAGCAMMLAGTAVLAMPAGCSSTRIAIAEQFGYAKRDQLVSRVEEARDGQQEAKKQFESALAEFIAVTGATDAELEAKYNTLKKELERSQSKADSVRSRITSVENVGEALFREWKSELKQYKSDSLRAQSEQQLNQTREKYGRMVGAMKAAAGKMDPVLGAFSDQVLFLKHNLNARAVSALQGNVDQLQSEITSLVQEMEASIAEANRFIDGMKE
jgi:chromosome segregation ATPase